MPLKVLLSEKTRGVLKSQNLELKFGKGGGELDLADFVEDRQGSFHVAVETELERGESPQRVFFLSNGKRRKIDGMVHGAGCHSYYEISSAFEKAMKGEGFLVNTTDQRHVSALAGTFFFAVSHGGKLHLAQLTIKDSRFRGLHCRR